MHSHSQSYSIGLSCHTHLHTSMCEAYKHTHIHMFSIKQTGKNIMANGRNGVRFPIGPAAPWWAMGLEVGP